MYYLSNCIKIQKKHSETTNLFMIHNMYLAWIIHGVAVKVAESYIVTVF